MCQDRDPEDETRRQELALEGDEGNLKPIREVSAPQRTLLSSRSRDTRNSLGLTVGSMSECLILETGNRGSPWLFRSLIVFKSSVPSD